MRSRAQKGSHHLELFKTCLGRTFCVHHEQKSRNIGDCLDSGDQGEGLETYRGIVWPVEEQEIFDLTSQGSSAVMHNRRQAAAHADQQSKEFAREKECRN
jgi:hypothetical protein